VSGRRLASAMIEQQQRDAARFARRQAPHRHILPSTSLGPTYAGLRNPLFRRSRAPPLTAPDRSCNVAAGELSCSLPLPSAGDPAPQCAWGRSGDARRLSLRESSSELMIDRSLASRCSAHAAHGAWVPRLTPVRSDCPVALVLATIVPCWPGLIETVLAGAHGGGTCVALSVRLGRPRSPHDRRRPCVCLLRTNSSHRRVGQRGCSEVKAADSVRSSYRL